MSHLPPPQQPLRHPYWIVAAVCLLAMMSTVGVSMPYPILAPIFVDGPADAFTHFAGLQPSVLMGFALAANPAGILIGSLFTGPLSDRYGRRAVLAATLTATLLGYILTAGALALRHYPLFVVARFATGLTESNVAVARALLADMHEQVDRARSFAWLNAFLYSGWLLGPLIGGMTLPLGEPVPFLLAGAMMLPSLLVLAVALPATPPPSVPQHVSEALQRATAWGALRADKAMAHVFWLQLAYTLGLTAFYEFEPLWMLQQAGLGSRGIAFVTAGQCVFMTLASVGAGRVGGGTSHPLRRAALIALGAAVGFSLLAAAPGTAGLALIMLLGVPTALYNAVMPAWMSERFAAHGQGRVMGLLSTIFCVSNVFVAIAGGWIALLSTRWNMGLAGAACVVSSVLMLRLARSETRRLESVPAGAPP